MISEEQHHRLFKVNKEFTHCLVTDPKSIEELRYADFQSTSSRKIVLLRGTHCKTVDHFFYQIQAAMQFPYYFGENHAALNDCMTDLSWMSFESMLLIITDAHLFCMEESVDQHRILYESLLDVAKFWENAEAPYARPFKYVFQVEAQYLDLFNERMQALGLEEI